MTAEEKTDSLIEKLKFFLTKEEISWLYNLIRCTSTSIDIDNEIYFNYKLEKIIKEIE